MKAVPTDRKPATDHANHGRRVERPARERHSGEGSASALANLRSMERDRQQRAIPPEDAKRE